MKLMPKASVKPGFTLIEIVLSLLLILAILTVFFVGSSTYTTSRGANLAGIATKIASREIETLRKTDFASLPASGSFADPDIAKLPQGTATRTITDYETNPDIKQVIVQVDWVVAGSAKNIKLDTLIYKYGL